MRTSDDKDLRGFEARLLTLLMEVVREGRDSVPQGSDATVPRGHRTVLGHHWPKVAVVMCAALVIAIVIPILSDDPLRGALAISRHGDTLYLRVEDARADPEAMTNDLRAAGLDAKVELIPASRSFVGKWIEVNGNAGTGEHDPGLNKLIDQVVTGDPAGALVLEVPADFSTPLTLGAGRPAGEGERWVLSHSRDVPDETAPGGIVHCLQLLDPTEADQILTELGYEVEWRTEHLTGPDDSGILSEPPSGQVIVYGELHGPNLLSVSTADADNETARRRIEIREREQAQQNC